MSADTTTPPSTPLYLADEMESLEYSALNTLSNKEPTATSAENTMLQELASIDHYKYCCKVTFLLRDPQEEKQRIEGHHIPVGFEATMYESKEQTPDMYGTTLNGVRRTFIVDKLLVGQSLSDSVCYWNGDQHYPIEYIPVMFSNSRVDPHRWIKLTKEFSSGMGFVHDLFTGTVKYYMRLFEGDETETGLSFYLKSREAKEGETRGMPYSFQGLSFSILFLS